ncbi:hypothetical protein M5X15_27305, partial [Paenibacillus apiarius]
PDASPAGNARAETPRGAAALRRDAAPPAQERRTPSARSGAQRVYIKITADRERPELLQELKQLLKTRPGPLPTVLFYEREQQLIALNEAYALKPSPELFKQIEAIFGDGTVRVK